MCECFFLSLCLFFFSLFSSSLVTQRCFTRCCWCCLCKLLESAFIHQMLCTRSVSTSTPHHTVVQLAHRVQPTSAQKEREKSTGKVLEHSPHSVHSTSLARAFALALAFHAARTLATKRRRRLCKSAVACAPHRAPAVQLQLASSIFQFSSTSLSTSDFLYFNCKHFSPPSIVTWNFPFPFFSSSSSFAIRPLDSLDSPLRTHLFSCSLLLNTHLTSPVSLTKIFS